jgi:hypothetical protein
MHAHACTYQRFDFFSRVGVVGEALEATGGSQAEREADNVRINSLE